MLHITGIKFFQKRDANAPNLSQSDEYLLEVFKNTIYEQLFENDDVIKVLISMLSYTLNYSY